LTPRQISSLQFDAKENPMTNQNSQRSGKNEEDDTKSGGKRDGGKNQGTKTGTGTTRAGEENTRKSENR
jgi:hypothetical protein